MQLSLCLISIAILVSVVNGDFDQSFCIDRMQEIGPNDDQGMKPAFYDNFYVLMEKKTSSVHSVTYEDEYFSIEAGMAYGTVRGPVNTTQTWVDTNTDEIIVGPIGQQVCTAKTLNILNSEQLVGVTVNAAGNVTLSTPEVALGWDKSTQRMIKNKGAGTARGISTYVWNVCSYNALTDVTAFSEWHIVDPSQTEMPVVTKLKVNKPILPVLVIVETNDYRYSSNSPNHTYSDNSSSIHPDNGATFRNVNIFLKCIFHRIDFTFFDNIQPTDEIFQTPPAMLCSTKPSSQVPLPTAPSYFKFKGEQITITNVISQTPDPPALVYTVEEYSQLSQLFIQDFITKPEHANSINDKSYIRNIDDFSTGLTFQVNLIIGSCSVSQISSENVDAVPIAGGNVAMRTSQQFFDLDSDQYQYMGIHTKRGIACDTWSAYFTDGKSDHQQNTLYTWYFANAQWMKTYNFGSTFPVALEVQQDSTYTLFNIYEFDTQDSLKLPDVSLCFDPSTSMNIDFHISASYTQFVAPDTHAFNTAIYDAIVLATSLKSVLRIAKLDVQPFSSSDIIVRFDLLDMASIKTQGDVSVPQRDAPNVQILADFCQQLNSGQFVIDIVSSSGTGKRTVTAQAYSSGQCQGPASPTTSLQSRQPTTIESQSFSDQQQSSGYTAGSMGGIAMGMLGLGLVLGVLVVFSLKRFRRSKSDPVFNMEQLKEEQL